MTAGRALAPDARRLVLSPGVLEALRRWTGAPERCALLLGHRRGPVTRVDRIEPTSNASPSPSRSFLIDPSALLHAARRGDLVGVAHSHPSGSDALSDLDRRCIEAWPDLIHVVSGQTVRAWSGAGAPVPIEVAAETALESAAS